jgi:hypothetical protein
MANHSGLTMSAYRKFSDAVRSEFPGGVPAKPPKAPKLDPAPAAPTPETLGGLGVLGEAGTETENPLAPADSALAIWGDTEEERAAIVEHEGKIPREWAEGFARLDPNRPPGDVPLSRWQRFVDDAGLFLDRWASYAAALGWGAHDLFGCDRDRPFARIDQCELLWLLNGARLVALCENTATIETHGGTRLTYHRKPDIAGRVLAWDLAP